jgi:hypothetical protein
MQFSKLKFFKKIKLFNFVFRWKMQKNSQKTHFGNIDGLDLRFYSIALKFRSQVQVRTLTLTLIHFLNIRVTFIYYILHYTKTNSKKVKQKNHLKTTIMYTHIERL